MKKIITKIIVLIFICTTINQHSLASSVVGTAKTDSSTALWKPKPSEEEVKNAVTEFKSLSKSDRKSRLHEAKAMLKEYKKNKRNGTSSEGETNTILLCILALLLPPLAVYLKTREFDWRFWVSILCTLLFWVPGVIFAFLVIFDVF